MANCGAVAWYTSPICGTDMDRDELAAKVARMRYLQIEAARLKAPRTVQECKRAEAEIDKILASMPKPPQGVQTTMF